MNDFEYYKTLADLRGQMVGALRQGNWPKYSLLVKEEEDLSKGFSRETGNPAVEDLSLRDLRKQNLSDALKAIQKAVQAILE